MRSLLDVNVLIALLDRQHAAHARAHEWLANNLSDGGPRALAAKKGGRLVTFDQSIPLSAIIGAKTDQLVVL